MDVIFDRMYVYNVLELKQRKNKTKLKKKKKKKSISLKLVTFPVGIFLAVRQKTSSYSRILPRDPAPLQKHSKL